MEYTLEHMAKGRVRIRMKSSALSFDQADCIEYYLKRLPFVTSVKTYLRTGGVAITYLGNINSLLKKLDDFSYENVTVPERFGKHSSRKLNEEYKEKLIKTISLRYFMKSVMPQVFGFAYITIRSLKFIYTGLKSLAKGKVDVSVLDATAIGTSFLLGDFKTAGSIMFLLTIGEILEEWTHKKSVTDLANTMALNTGKVWIKTIGESSLIDASLIEVDDNVVVNMGNMIPFDGLIVEGDAMVNMVSLTGESTPVHKKVDSYVYAGTVVEEGEITICVKELSGTTRYDRIVKMIEDSENLKSKVENKAEDLANRLVPYTFMGTGLVWLLTRNISKTLTVLLVDFSCALKLAIPISVLSAIREGRQLDINIKGGKYLEAMAEADTIVFDKTGTLTEATPSVVDIVNFGPGDVNEKFRIAACLEEHFPHSVARAVVNEAKARGLEHEEMHSDVEYIVAHGIVSYVDGLKVMVGSEHFIFQDEGCHVREEYLEVYENLPKEYSHLFYAVEDKLEAVLLIEDPLRKSAAKVVSGLKELGIKKTLMMTGDNDRVASSIAEKVGIDKYYAQVLPDQKDHYVEEVRNNDNTVAMLGDGINDAPALSAADVGIAMDQGAELAREISDVMMMKDDLNLLVTFRKLSMESMKRIDSNYKWIVGINAALILLGVGGFMMPTTSALIHNASTVALSLNNMKNVLKA